MPTSARKSSIGRRITPSSQLATKAHIPYRGDNPLVGKKTGIAVRHVERKSDGFEDFEMIMQQADGRTPPVGKGRRKSSGRGRRRDEEDEDEDEEEDNWGEESMQIDSPIQHLTNLRPPTTPTALKRRQSTSRPVARTSDVDFDQIPSPRRQSRVSTASSVQRGRNASFGPSRLSTSSRFDFGRRSPELGDDSYMTGNDGDATMDMDMTMDAGAAGGDFDMDDYGPEEDERTAPVTPVSKPMGGRPRSKSFGGIDADEGEGEEELQEDEDMGPQGGDEEEEQEETPKASPQAKQKQKEKEKAAAIKAGKAKRVRSPTPDHSGMEEDIAQGLQDVEFGDAEEDEDEDEAEQRREEERRKKAAKKAKIIEVREKVKDKEKEKRRTSSGSKKENKPYREGIRKSKRESRKPLEYWRGERYVYGRPETETQILTAAIVEVVRVPKEPVQPLGAKYKRGSTRARSRSRARTVDEDDMDGIPPALPVVNPEEGWDDETNPKCQVIHYTTKEEVERRIAWTAKMVEPKMAGDGGWMFDKIFGDDDFIAAGQLVIPPRGRKPSKAAKDNTYIFCVLEGAVNLKIHETSMILSTGGMFMVPRGNTYFIENICNRDARLFFTQARKVEMNAQEHEARRIQSIEMLKSRGSALNRSSSLGVGMVGSGSGSASPAKKATQSRAKSTAA